MEKNIRLLVNVYGCNDGISDIHGKNFKNNRDSIVNTTDLTLKKMFDITAELVSEQEEITGFETIGWERIINLQRTKVYVFFRFCIVSWEDPSESGI